MQSCEKERYETHKLAIDAANFIGKRDRVSMHVYNCNNCNGYHLATSGKKRFIKNIRHGIMPVKRLQPNPGMSKKFQPSRAYATEKMISPEMASHLKRLIEGKNQMDKQKNNGANKSN